MTTTSPAQSAEPVTVSLGTWTEPDGVLDAIRISMQMENVKRVIITKGPILRTLKGPYPGYLLTVITDPSLPDRYRPMIAVTGDTK